jgi:hypothetical protein
MCMSGNYLLMTFGSKQYVPVPRGSRDALLVSLPSIMSSSIIISDAVYVISKQLKTAKFFLISYELVVQLIKKSLALNGTQTFVAMFTIARHPCLSWATLIQPNSSNTLRHISISSSHLCLDLPSGIFPLSVLTRVFYTPTLYSAYFNITSLNMRFRPLRIHKVFI